VPDHGTERVSILLGNLSIELKLLRKNKAAKNSFAIKNLHNSKVCRGDSAMK
jgi:hypothetical protein